MLGFLNDLDVATTAVADVPIVGGDHTGLGRAVQGPGAYIQQATGIPLELRRTRPPAFASAYAIATEDLMVQSIPGPMFLSLAFDAFIKVHATHVSEHAPSIGHNAE